MLSRYFQQWSVIDDGLLIALRDFGLPVRRIAELIGRTAAGVETRRDVLLNIGLIVTQWRLSDGEVECLKSLWASGMLTQDIARAMDRHPCTIRRWRRLLCLPDRVRRGSPWGTEDDDFVLEWYGREPGNQRWIGRSLPSGRKVSRDAVIGRYHRLMHKGRKITQQARQQQEDTAAPV